MRHSYFGRKLSRTTNERQQLFRNLLRALITHGSITTTMARAKAIAPSMEKLITKAKVGNDPTKRAIFAQLGDKDATRELLGMAIKLGLRTGDAAEMVQLSFVDVPVAVSISVEKKEKKPKKEVKSPKRTKMKKYL
ncbi:50S ribosomal protein L17 [Candidatus Gottesmanbacteria bacterium]|nr:50S ribosomal protein L17 [Candidatus Gottesmanbacteria bacterium]